MTFPRVVSVSSDDEHRFTKPRRAAITLVAGLGVEGDAHFGATVQHLSRVRRDPTQPNLRQVHLIHRELLDEVDADVSPGELGENITTEGIDLLALTRGTLLRLGADAVVEVTGLRNPCLQIDRFESGLLKQVVGTDAQGRAVRKAGVMGVVRAGGVVTPGDPIVAEIPAGAGEPLAPV
ncbi:MOSC domain-containing protein [Microbacterium sp. ANT_H45B]|uniref:MOSC domain-containing protein n=1 Tax=Microbacterium sp. ANT_H45B TaxID=2597346 RepID=UPI0011EF7F23|nr:MOSC domain-containing protein [Microbacterium sp. ANT_H45B]KAA0961971.1 MOSC domain-containing protein [Microbacterium sp. ANT_H45B]